jgi:hypothetical protein
MIDKVNFIVRSSGRLDGQYYIDYRGLYKAADISRAAKIDQEKLGGVYLSNGGTLDTTLDIYYFTDMISAKKTISEIYAMIKKPNKGRVVTLTEPEIDYIRNALINEAGFAAINTKVKDAIFKKLNG